MSPSGFVKIQTCFKNNRAPGFANNKDTNQPVHPYSLISVLVIRVLESIISKLAICKAFLFWLVSVAEQAGLNLTLSETPKTEAHMYLI